MPRRLTGGFLFVLLIVVHQTPARAQKDENIAKKELERFQGTRQLVSALNDGVPTPEEREKQIRVAITGKTHTVTFGDDVIAKDVRFEIDPTTNPKQVNDTLDLGPHKGKQIFGIYKLDGDTLTSCVAELGTDRPTEFSSKPGSHRVLRVFRRVKP